MPFSSYFLFLRYSVKIPFNSLSEDINFNACPEISGSTRFIKIIYNSIITSAAHVPLLFVYLLNIQIMVPK